MFSGVENSQNSLDRTLGEILVASSGEAIILVFQDSYKIL
jgi:hypothetical protein